MASSLGKHHARTGTVAPCKGWCPACPAGSIPWKPAGLAALKLESLGIGEKVCALYRADYETQGMLQSSTANLVFHFPAYGGFFCFIIRFLKDCQIAPDSSEHQYDEA